MHLTAFSNHLHFELTKSDIEHVEDLRRVVKKGFRFALH